MARTKVTFLNKEDRFEMVSFVNDPKMTPFRLKLFIKQLWSNFSDLANAFQHRRPDVSDAIDKILDGKTWSEKDLGDRFLYGKYEEFIIQFDTLDKKIVIMNEVYEAITKPIDALSLKEAKTLAKEARKEARTQAK
jgi:hypothetical protein